MMAGTISVASILKSQSPKPTPQTHRSKNLKNPLHGICGAEANEFTRHTVSSHDPRRRHNEERRDEAGRKLKALLESHP